jgi:hypothetical protein
MRILLARLVCAAGVASLPMDAPTAGSPVDCADLVISAPQTSDSVPGMNSRCAIRIGTW